MALASTTGDTYNEPVVAPSSKDFAPGVAFGSYVVRELIGRGGMASVYRAEHVLLQKPVALKLMDRALLVSSAARQRFLLEGRAAASIKHPNVVDITDVGVHEGLPYLVMELLEGEDLDTHLRKRTVMDDGAAIRLALPIIAALHAAHSCRVVHRDIKPSNIFMSVGPDGQVVPKVLDFGISKVGADSATLESMGTPQHHIIGTPRYLPPEALHGAREIGPLSDQYSLGVVLYQCVTGRTPFSGDTLISLLNSLSRGAFEPPRTLQPSVSPGLDRVITRALSPEPSDRFPTIRDMGRALLELAATRTQMVWGQSFRPPQTAGEDGASRDYEPLPSPNTLPTTELLSRQDDAARSRWRHRFIGAGLLLTGALVSALWSALPSLKGSRAGHGSSGDAASGQHSPERGSQNIPAATLLPSVASAQGPAREGDGTALLGLAPSRPEPKITLAEPVESPAPTRRAASTTTARRRSSPAKTIGKGAAEGRPANTAAAAQSSAPPARPEPERARAVAERSPHRPRQGANRSPLLD